MTVVGFFYGAIQMGNWRRVKIEGTCDRGDVPALRDALTLSQNYENFHCLIHNRSICGLPNWADEKICAVGNLAERGYDEESVAETLEELASGAPSLSLLVHVGGDNESQECVATVKLKNGKATIDDPIVDAIPEIGNAQMEENLIKQLLP